MRHADHICVHTIRRGPMRRTRVHNELFKQRVDVLEQSGRQRRSGLVKERNHRSVGKHRSKGEALLLTQREDGPLPLGDTAPCHPTMRGHPCQDPDAILSCQLFAYTRAMKTPLFVHARTMHGHAIYTRVYSPHALIDQCVHTPSIQTACELTQSRGSAASSSLSHGISLLSPTSVSAVASACPTNLYPNYLLLICACACGKASGECVPHSMICRAGAMPVPCRCYAVISCDQLL